MPLPDAVPISSIIYVCPILSFSSAVSIGSLTVLSDEDSVNTALTNANSTQTRCPINKTTSNNKLE